MLSRLVHSRAGAILLTLAIMASYALFADLRAKHSWDSIPYTALVLSLDEPYGPRIHLRTYALLEQALSADQYRKLTNATPFRQQVHRSWEALRQQLPLFAIKPLYVIAAYGFYKLGLSPVDGLVWVSVLSTILLAIGLTAWFYRYLPGLAASVTAVGLLVVTGALFVGNIARPAALSGLLLAACAYFIWAKPSYRWALVTAIASVLARPENLLFALLIAVYLRWFADPTARIRPPTMLLAVVAATGIYWFVEHHYGAYGWQLTFYYAFVDKLPYPEGREIVLTLSDYLRRLWWSVLEEGTSLQLGVFVVYVTGATYLALRSQTTSVRYWFAGCVLLCMAHILVYPSLNVRFFVPYYLLIASAAVAVFLSERKGDRRRTGLERANEGLG